MKNIIILISVGFFLAFTGCTKLGVKNRALAQSIEKFDSDAEAASKVTFVDKEQQKLFTDFIRLNTQIDVDDVELQGDSDATARLTIKTFSKSIYPELQATSGKEWKSKIAKAMETKTYNLKLKKIDNAWKVVEQIEVPQ